MAENKLPEEIGIDDLLEELPPLNPALVQGNCNIAPAPHKETQGKQADPVVVDNQSE